LSIYLTLIIDAVCYDDASKTDKAAHGPIGTITLRAKQPR